MPARILNAAQLLPLGCSARLRPGAEGGRWTCIEGLAYYEAMKTNVTELSVRDNDGNIRSLLVSTKLGEGGEQSVAYNLGTLLVVQQEDGTFQVSETGEVLTLPDTLRERAGLLLGDLEGRAVADIRGQFAPLRRAGAGTVGVPEQAGDQSSKS